MTTFLTMVFFSACILLSRYFFKDWFNHAAIYSIAWMTTIVLYEMKLMHYVPINNLTWFVISAVSALFMSGCLLVVTARYSLGKGVRGSEIRLADTNSLHLLFADGGKTIRFLIIVFSVLALGAAIQHWMVLIGKFGSIGGVFLQAGKVYRMRVEGELEGVVPYIGIAGHIGVVLAGIYTAYRGKLSLYTVLPLIMVSLKELASFGRAGVLFGLLEFVTSFTLFRQVLSKQGASGFSRRTKYATFVVLLTIGLLTAGAVKQTRGVFENYKSAGSTLKQLRNNPVISPSIYLYLSVSLGILSEYMEQLRENPYVGENTFMPVYNVFAKFGVVQSPNAYQMGYFTPMWSNTATYIREIHADFGVIGLFLVPILLGAFTTFFWYRFHERGRMIYLIILVFLYLIVFFSIFVMVTRLAIWFVTFIALLLIVWWAESRNRKYILIQNPLSEKERPEDR